MEVKITDLHPTQLYLSEKKLHDIQMMDQSADIINEDPISVLAFGNRFLITDGHHRAYLALLAGRDTISAELIEMVAMNSIISMRKLARKERIILCFGFKTSYLTSR